MKAEQLYSMELLGPANHGLRVVLFLPYWEELSGLDFIAVRNRAKGLKPSKPFSSDGS